MDIKGTMRKYGYTMEQLAAKINGSQSSLSQVMSNPSPTLKMLDRIADGLGCKRWEFFLDEMDRDEVMAKLGISAASAQTDGQQSEQEELPFCQQQPSQEQQPQGTTLVGLVRCPQCGHSIRLFAEE